MFDFLIPFLAANPLLLLGVGAVSLIGPAVVRGFGWQDTPVGRVVLILGNDIGGAVAKKAAESEKVKP